MTTFDGHAVDHVMKFTRPSPSVFAYCKRSKTGGVEGLGTRLGSRHMKIQPASGLRMLDVVFLPTENSPVEPLCAETRQLF